MFWIDVFKASRPPDLIPRPKVRILEVCQSLRSVSAFVHRCAILVLLCLPLLPARAHKAPVAGEAGWCRVIVHAPQSRSVQWTLAFE